MKVEYDALRLNKTWILVPYPPYMNVVGCKWIFLIKHNSYGFILKHKARLVAKGFQQIAGLIYHDMFNPIVKGITIHIILTLAITFNREV